MWNPEKEQIAPEQLKSEQSRALIEKVKTLYERVTFYREKMDIHGVKPGDIKSIDDISKLPFTTKMEMRDVYPYGMLAVDRSEIVEVHTSSGTTGKPVVGAYTRNDIELWSETMARTLGMGGVDSSDTVQNMFGYGMFTGGLGVHYGARRIGANSPSRLQRQFKTPVAVNAGFRDFHTYLHPVILPLPG